MRAGGTKDREECGSAPRLPSWSARALQATQLRLRLQEAVSCSLRRQSHVLSQSWPTSDLRARVVVSEDHERAHQFRATVTLRSATPVGPQKLRRGRCARGPRAGKRPCPNLDSSSATDIETRGKHRAEKKAFRARADSAQSARQGGIEPGTTRFRDGRTTTRPPAPRRDHGAPTAQPRPRGPDLESAQI